METCAVALWPLLIVRLLTVIPPPRMACVTPCLKLVYWPRMFTVSDWPCCPAAGETESSVALKGRSMRKPTVAYSEPVLTKAVRQPRAAELAIATCAVSVVGLVTVTPETVISGPYVSVVCPATKCVSTPCTATVSVCPSVPEFGVMLEM